MQPTFSRRFPNCCLHLIHSNNSYNYRMYILQSSHWHSGLILLPTVNHICAHSLRTQHVMCTHKSLVCCIYKRLNIGRLNVRWAYLTHCTHTLNALAHTHVLIYFQCVLLASSRN